MIAEPLQPGRRVPLALAYKGERTYLHGTDMVDALVALQPGLSHVSLRIQKIATRQLAAVLLPDDSIARRDMVAILTGESAGEKLVIGLIEQDGAAPPERYPYDEALVLAGAEIDTETQTARLPWNDRYSFLEQLVALQKALLMQCFAAPELHWYFTRLDIVRIPAAVGALSLTVNQALGSSLVRSNVCADDERLGDIYFSGVRQ